MRENEERQKNECIEIDRIDENGWLELTDNFDDATLYQTWTYGRIRRGDRNLSHLVLKRNGEIIGICQISFRALAYGAIPIAYVIWGPLWRKKGTEPNVEDLALLLKGLKEEYGVRRGCFLRITSNALGENKELVRSTATQMGFTLSTAAAYRTLRLNLMPSLEVLRKNLLQKWRNCLNKAEKSDLLLRQGTTDDLYGHFLNLAAEMVRRKGFKPGIDYQQFARIQRELPQEQKMQVFVCFSGSDAVAATVCTALGSTGIYLLGATGDRGMGLNASYLLHWNIIKWLKEQGFIWYDLGGIDPASNPGVYDFKLGIAGKTGLDETFLNELQGCFTLRARFAKWLHSTVTAAHR